MLALTPGLHFSLETRLRHAVANSTHSHCQPGQALSIEGDTSDSLLLLVKGQVLVTQQAGEDVVRSEGQVIQQLQAGMGETNAVVPSEIPKLPGHRRGSEVGSTRRRSPSPTGAQAAGFEPATSRFAPGGLSPCEERDSPVSHPDSPGVCPDQGSTQANDPTAQALLPPMQHRDTATSQPVHGDTQQATENPSSTTGVARLRVDVAGATSHAGVSTPIAGLVRDARGGSDESEGRKGSDASRATEASFGFPMPAPESLPRTPHLSTTAATLDAAFDLTDASASAGVPDHAHADTIQNSQHSSDSQLPQSRPGSGHSLSGGVGVAQDNAGGNLHGLGDHSTPRVEVSAGSEKRLSPTMRHPVRPASSAATSDRYTTATTPAMSPVPGFVNPTEEDMQRAFESAQLARGDASQQQITLSADALAAGDGDGPGAVHGAAGVDSQAGAADSQAAAAADTAAAAPAGPDSPAAANKVSHDAAAAAAAATALSPQRQGSQRTVSDSQGVCPPPTTLKGMPLYNALAMAIRASKQQVIAVHNTSVFLGEEGLKAGAADR